MVQGMELKRRLDRQDNMMAHLIQIFREQGKWCGDVPTIEAILEEFTPAPEPMGQVDLNSKDLKRPEVKNLLLDHWAGNITDEEYREKLNELVEWK